MNDPPENDRRPVFPGGPPPWPRPNPAVTEALRNAAADGSWGRYEGPHSQHLAAAIRTRFHCQFVLLCSSGTLAVELALRGLGVEPGSEVLIAGYDFPGNFRAIEAVGARPVLVDLAENRWTFGADELEAGWSPQVRAVIVSHLHSDLAPLPSICAWAQRRGIAVVEDACQAPGAIVQGRPAGTWGDVGVLSFGGSKLLTAGRGGAVLSQRADVYQRAKVFGERGNQAFPLSELQAAVLLPQIEQLEAANQQRRENVARLRARLATCAGLQPSAPTDAGDAPSFYKLSWFCQPPGGAGWTREVLLAEAQAEGIALDSGFRGFVGRSSQRCRKVGELPGSRRAVEATVLLHHPILLEEPPTIDRLATTLDRLIERLNDTRRLD